MLNFAFGQDIAYMADPMQAKATVKAMKDFILTYKGLLEKVVKVKLCWFGEKGARITVEVNLGKLIDQLMIQG